MKPSNMFSRRHQTAEAHLAAHQKKLEHEQDWRQTIEDNREARVKRSAKSQLKLIATRRGESKKETARLLAQIEEKKVKDGKTS